MVITLHLASDAEEFEGGRTVMLVITGGVNSIVSTW